MTLKRFRQVAAVAIALTAVCVSAYAQKTVYKWVDEDGVVHFSEAPPGEENTAETETLVIPKSPPAPAPAPPVAKPATVSQESDKNQSKQPVAEAPPVFEKIDITKMSIADLDLRCDKAREKMIAPLREAEIAKCKQDKSHDPAWCERFNADYGDGGRTLSGSIRPRMFDDLPECVEAMQEQNRRR